MKCRYVGGKYMHFMIANTIIMGSARGGPLSPLRAMMGDSAEEFNIASDGEGRIDLPSPRRCSLMSSPVPATTISFLECWDAFVATSSIFWYYLFGD
jgi:hypothetical protein